MKHGARSSWCLLVGSVLAVACGGQVEANIGLPPVNRPEPVVVTTPTEPEPEPARPLPPETPQTPELAEILVPTSPPQVPETPPTEQPGTEPPVPQPPVSEPPVAPPRSDPAALGLPPERVACPPGQDIEMSYRVPGVLMSARSGEPEGDGFCTGPLRFQGEVNGSLGRSRTVLDYNTDPPKPRFALSNGKSFDPNAPDLALPSTLVHADGRREEHACSYEVICISGSTFSGWFDL